MYQDAGSREILQHMNDPGIYYVYENGKLKSPPGFSRTRKISEQDEITCTENNKYSNFYSPNKTKKKDGQHQPPALLTICIDFVATNIEYVDSLIGFPEIIGKQIFNDVVKSNRLSFINSQSTRILQVFSDAYADILLEELVLKNSTLVLENCIQIILNCFNCLKLLDLHGCRLGDDHEMLNIIGNNQSLLHVGLCDNVLSDKALQNFTAPMRMFGRGPVQLKTLDLSCNPLITDKGMRFIISFVQLETLDLSGTKVSNIGKMKIEVSPLNLVQDTNHPKSTPVLNTMGTKGWAKDVVENWLIQNKTNPLHGMPKSSLSEAAKFYTRNKPRLKLAENMMQSNTKIPSRDPHIILKQKCLVNLIQAQNDKSKNSWKNRGRGYVCGSSTRKAENLQRKEQLSSPFTLTKSHNSSRKKSPKQKLYNLVNTIDFLTQPEDDLDNIDNVTKSKKRKCESDNDSRFSPTLGNSSSNKKRKNESDHALSDYPTIGNSSTSKRYSIEEQDILSNYLVPSEQKISPTSLFEAMNSGEWENQ